MFVAKHAPREQKPENTNEDPHADMDIERFFEQQKDGL
jgi:hypothetical protein